MARRAERDALARRRRVRDLGVVRGDEPAGCWSGSPGWLARRGPDVRSSISSIPCARKARPFSAGAPTAPGHAGRGLGGDHTLLVRGDHQRANRRAVRADDAVGARLSGVADRGQAPGRTIRSRPRYADGSRAHARRCRPVKIDRVGAVRGRRGRRRDTCARGDRRCRAPGGPADRCPRGASRSRTSALPARPRRPEPSLSQVLDLLGRHALAARQHARGAPGRYRRSACPSRAPRAA